MDIKYGNYILRQTPASNDRFDLYRVSITTKEGSKNIGKEKETSIAFGCDLARALERISFDIMNDKVNQVSIKEWIDEYKKVIADLKEAIQLG